MIGNWLFSRRHRALKAAALMFPVLICTFVCRSQVPAQGPAGHAAIDFARDIQPIFAQSCYQCHGDKVQMAGLRLDAKAMAMRGGQSGAVIIPGKSKDSLLYRRVTGGGDQARMPMGASHSRPSRSRR